jgi:cytosine/adenosine deaminase-related metal-dependent hydrolase
MLRRGCRVALGLDGLALDEDDDALREMRLTHLLHAGTGFCVEVDRAAMLSVAFVNGRRAVLNADDGGEIAAGQPADLLLLDWNALDEDRLRPDIDPSELLFARATARHVRELIVAGRTVVENGRVSGFDYPAAHGELLTRLRAGMAQNARLAAALPALERAVAMHFEPPCC